MKKSIIIFAVLMLISALTAICGTCRIPARLENYAEDYLYQRLDGITEDIKIIAIDDETLEVLGPYSEWNRMYFADLITLLNADAVNRPRLIGILLSIEEVLKYFDSNEERQCYATEYCYELYPHIYMHNAPRWWWLLIIRSAPLYGFQITKLRNK